MAHRRTNSQRGLHPSMKHQQPPLSPIPASPALSDDAFSLPSAPSSPRDYGTHSFKSFQDVPWSPRPVAAAAAAAPSSLLSLPRQVHRRATYLALLSLVALSTFFLFFVSQPALPTLSSLRTTPSPLAPSSPAAAVTNDTPPAEAIAAAHRGASWRATARRPQLKLAPAEELAAMTAFVAALAENLIPPGADPAKPLDPDLVLDFDTRSTRARGELEELVRDTWLRNPVVLYTKRYQPASKEIKAALERMNLFPAPTVIEVDERADAGVVAPVLARLTGKPELPVLLVGGELVDGLLALGLTHADAALRERVEAAGAKIDGRRKKGGRKH